jgi:hypothetical protein
VLREVVEPEDAGVLGAPFGFRGDCVSDRLGAHFAMDLILVYVRND